MDCNTYGNQIPTTEEFMTFIPNPILYGVSEDFFSTFKIIITMCSEVQHKVLAKAVSGAAVRYPYFSIRPVKRNESLLLELNLSPIPVFDDGRCATLGSSETDGHLLTFGCEGNRIILNVSHCIADGMGIVPFIKTVLFLYVLELYGDEGLAAERILMPESPISDEEYSNPFFCRPCAEAVRLPFQKADRVYALDPQAFDENGLYAYHLRIPQKEMMALANPSDGSPVSFLSVMLYRAIGSVDGGVDRPVVVHVQHQYRAALNTPLNRHSLVSYIPISIAPRGMSMDIGRLNTILRGQIILGSEPESDIEAVNRLVQALSPNVNESLGQKKQSMRQYMANSVRGKTFGISYVGKMDWCGLDRYVEDMHVYIGEKNARNMLLIEVMTVGDDFSLTFMQGGRGTRYVDAFVQQLRAIGIPVSVIGEEEYTLCDTVVPD
jgi:hypothetical protein